MLNESLEQRKNNLKKNTVQAKTNYFENKIKNSSNIQKTVWSIINSEVGEENSKVVKNISLRNETNTGTLTDPKLISEAFNDYFVNIVEDVTGSNSTTLSADITVNNNDKAIQDCIKREFNFRFVDAKEVEKVINSLKNKNSLGHDDIPVKVIKISKHYLSKVLSHLINSSFVSGIFPKQLKKSKVISIHKKSDNKTKSNYRPISILPIISKIYEKIVSNQFTNYLEENRIFNNIQHGFRPGKSVITAAVSFIESIIESVDKGEYTTGIFMDLSKAFDSVSHPILIQKLQTMGVSKNAIKWFQSYLNGRCQFVEITHVTHDNYVKKILETNY